MSCIPGKFIWFEHLSDDLPRAKAFYEALFGWQVKPFPMGAMTYDMIHNGDQAVGGLFPAPQGVPNQWVSHLSVLDVDASHRAALAAGAQSAMPPQDFPPVGRGASVIDPTGAAISIWHSSDGDRPDVDQPPVGEWAWNELMTSDVPRALAFYQEAFGLASEKMAFEGFDYFLLKTPDGKSRGGVMAAPEGMPSLWIPYVTVANADETAGKAEKLGGKLMMPIQAVPGVGQVATLTDPLGATVAFIQPAG